MIDDFDNKTALVVLYSGSIEQVQELNWQPGVLDALQEALDGRVVEEDAVLVLEATVVRMEMERETCLLIPLAYLLAPPVEVVSGH